MATFSCRICGNIFCADTPLGSIRCGFMPLLSTLSLQQKKKPTRTGNL